MNVVRRLWKWLAASFAVAVIALALLVGLFRMLLPLVPEYHEQIEGWASAAIGLPVTVDRVDARWRLGGPELIFYNARLHAPDSEEILLRAESGSVGVGLLRLLRTFSLDPGRIILRGAQIDIVRDPQGEWLVLGRVIPAAGSGPGGGIAALPKAYFELHETSLLIHDQMGGGPPLTLSGLRLHFEHGDHFLRLDGSARLPEELGYDVSFSAQAEELGRTGAPAKWQLYLEGEAIDLAGLTATIGPNRLPLDEGLANFSLWAALSNGRVEEGSASFDGDDLRFSAADAAPQRFTRVAGRLQWERGASSWQLSGSDLVVATADHTWPETRFRVEALEAPDGGRVLYADSNYLRLEELRTVLPWLPQGQWRDQLTAMAPRGEVRELVFQHARPASGVSEFSVEAGFNGLGFAAHDGVPGADGLRGTISMDASSGRVDLAAPTLVLDLPTVFAQAPPGIAAEGAIAWDRQADGWRVGSNDLVLANPQIRLRSEFEVLLPAGDGPPLLDLQAHIDALDLAHAHHYFPSRKMSQPLQDWLGRAIGGGRAHSGELSFIGPVNAFPFEQNEGDFRASLEFEDATLNYASDWPAGSGLKGRLRFYNASFSGEVDEGDILQSRFRSTTGTIPDLRAPVLELRGVAAGPLQSIIEYLQGTPLADRVGPLVHRMSATGEGDLHLDISVPIRDRSATMVRARLDTQNGGLQFRDIRQQFERIDGTIEFSGQGLSATGVNAMLLGRPVTVDIAPEYSDDSGKVVGTQIFASGRLDAVDLGDRLHPLLGEVLRGSSVYRATARLPRFDPLTNAPFEVTVESDLDGTQVDLPDPVNKASGQAVPVVVRVVLEAPERLQLSVDYGDATRALFESVRGVGGWDLSRGAIRLGGSAPLLPDHSGVTVEGTAGPVDISAWLARGGKDSGFADRLASLDVQFDSMTAFGQRFAKAQLAIDRSGSEWLVQVETAGASGVLFVPFNFEADAPLIAKLDRLHIGVDEAAAGDTPPPDPRKLPAIQAQVTDFRYGDMQFGALELDLERTPDGVRFAQIKTTASAYQITGDGEWRLTAFGHNTNLELRLNSTDLLATLSGLGFEPNVSGKTAEIVGNLHWPGAPGARFREQLSGEVSVRVGPGQLQSVQPGAGRMFGLLSVAALPRRLSLDFRDVFDKGFGFDRIAGDFNLEAGNAYTNNLVLEGPAADVGIVGRTGLVTRDYDQTAVVYASFGSSLPVAGALAAGPAVGAALLIFSQIFKKPLKEMSRAYYRITGSWDDPQVERALASQVDESDSAKATPAP